MGYFAVLARGDEKAHIDHVKVTRLHVNIWALRGLWFGRRLFHVDVGIELTFTGKPEENTSVPEIRAIELLLPFRVEEGRWPSGAPVAQDLYSQVIDDSSGPLIFGSPVEIVKSFDGRSTIRYEDKNLTVIRIKEDGVRPADNYVPTNDSSLYVIPFKHALKQGESAYFRIRWRVFGAAPLWQWSRPESGARVDFRVCDTRQGSAAQRDPDFLARILPIVSANVFIMAPGQLAPTNVSPIPKHIRTLETAAWKEYLKGAANWQWMARGLLVYGWHRPEREDGRSITEDDPLRIFLALNRPTSRPGWLIVAYTTAGFIIAWTLLSLPQRLIQLPNIISNVTPIVGLIGIGSLMGLWTLIQRIEPFLSDRARRPRAFLRRIERFFLAR